MCGIVGYIGDKDIEKVLITSLSRLEYRGYDSAGIATLNEGRISLLKEQGKLKALKELTKENPLLGRFGIGHTRWATHGIPSKQNAHPHTDSTGTLAVVHNGIVENHEKLRVELSAQGFEFRSDTDSEVIAHLIGRYHVAEKKSLEASVKLALKKIEGCYAFCVISTAEPDAMIAARNGSPLVVGIGAQENFVASDATAFLEHTRKAIFLEDDQMAIVSRSEAKVLSSEGNVVPNAVSTIDWDAKDAVKEGFDHFMLKEIEEQPKVMARMLEKRLDGRLEDKLFDQLKFNPSELVKTERILIQACGTSWHAALTGKFLLEQLAGIPTEVDVSSEFRYRELIKQPNTVVLSITQSGETIDTLMGLRHGREKGYKTLSICNVLGSTIARESDGVIFTHAGPEIGVASTKAYTAQLGILTLLALYWGQLRGKISSSELANWKKHLRAIPEQMKSLINQKGALRQVASKYFEARDFLFLGRGVNYPNAFEGALKIKEIAYIHATGHPAGEMKHGPIALIDEKLPVVVIAPSAALSYEKVASNAQEVKARSGKVIAILTEGDQSIRSFADDSVFVPNTLEGLSPLLIALPLQYLAYYVAVLRGTDVDQPRNLAKSVTVE